MRETVVAIVAFFCGMLVGGSLISDAFVSDCSEIGKFRTEGAVFECSKLRAKP